MEPRESAGRAPWQRRLYRVIFESDTAPGRAFDIALIALILASVAVVMLESVAAWRARVGPLLRAPEWGFTVAFTIEYLLRLACVRRPTRYATSFFGVVDLLAIVPTYASVLLPGAQYLLVIRVLRILRVFRVLKLAQYVGEARVLESALRASRRRIVVFLCAVATLVVILGSLMYLVEGPENGFTSIPRNIYWAIVTLTTIGYGDISPSTSAGQALAAVVMIIGYGILAVPTGIVTAELARRPAGGAAGDPGCGRCGTHGHSADARYCRTCGKRLAAS